MEERPAQIGSDGGRGGGSVLEDVVAQLRAREPLSHREPRDADRAHFEALFGDDLVWIGASGRVLNRTQYLEATLRRYESGDHGDDASWIVEDFTVTELTTGLWCAAYTLHQGERTSRRTTLWQAEDGRWRARRHQGTPVTVTA